MSGWHVMTLRGHPVIAFRVDGAAIGSATAAAISGFTPLRRLIRLGLEGVIRLGLHPLAARRRAELAPLLAGIEPEALVDAVQPLLAEPIVGTGIAWQLPPGRNERAYVHLFGRTGPLAFAKIALSPLHDQPLRREAAMMAAVGPDMLPGFTAPTLIGSGAVDGHAFVLTTPLPPGAVSIGRAALVQRLAAAHARVAPRTATGDEVVRCDWWRSFDLRFRGSACHRLLAPALDTRGLAVGPAHGDFGPHNAARVGDEVWLIDWERSSPSAPRWTDAVSMILADAPGRHQQYPRDGLRAIRQAVARDGGGAHDAIAALAYLADVGSRQAAGMLAVWPDEQETAS